MVMTGRTQCQREFRTCWMNESDSRRLHRVCYRLGWRTGGGPRPSLIHDNSGLAKDLPSAGDERTGPDVSDQPICQPARMSAAVAAALSANANTNTHGTRRPDASKFLAIGEICGEVCCMGHEGRPHGCGVSAVHPSTSGAPRSSIRNCVQGLAHRNNGAAATGANREDVQCVGHTERWWRVRC